MNTDDLKMARDGHLSAGRYHPSKCGMWPRVTSIGYDAEGTVVAVCRAFSPESGEIEYSANGGGDVVRWEWTKAGRELFG